VCMCVLSIGAIRTVKRGKITNRRIKTKRGASDGLVDDALGVFVYGHRFFATV
jgi:hypothetical protein